MDWHKQRLDDLNVPYGWLSLISLDWIGDEPQTLDTFPGVWQRRGDGVTVTFTAEDAVTRNGEPVTGELHLDEHDRTLRDSRGREAEYAPRFGAQMVRVRTEEFTPRDIPTYPHDEAWTITVPHRPTDDTVEVRSAQPFGTHTLQGTGYATIDGKEMLLTDGLIFSDPTGWRRAPATVSEDGATVTIDFNQSTIFPFHLSPYGTCPTAPASNHFDRTVEAGEISPQ